MKTHFTKIRSCLTLTCGVILATHSAHAASGTWDTDSAGNWTDITKWLGDADYASGTDFTATLGNSITANRIITLDTAIMIGNITASDTSHDYTISGANTLTLDTSSGKSILSVVSGRTLSIGTALTVNDGIQKTGAGAVTISGSTSLAGGIELLSGSGNLSFTNAIILAAPQSWTNNSSNSLVSTGGLNLNGNALTLNGTGLVNFSGTANIISGAGGITVSSGRFFLGAGGTTPTHTYSGATNLNGGVTMFNAAANLSVNSNININGGILESYWTSGLTRAQGTGGNQIRITGGESGFSMNGANGATFDIGAVTWGSATFNPTKFVLQSAFSQANSVVTFANNINLNGADRTILVNAGAGNARAQLNGIISNGTGTAGLIKEGAGVLIMNAQNTYNGATTVSAGILDFANVTVTGFGNTIGTRNITVANEAAVRRTSLNNAFLNRIVENSNEFTLMTGTITSGDINLSSSTGANLPNAFIGNWANNGAMANISGTATITPGSDGYKFGSPISSGMFGIALNLGDNGGATKLTIGGNRVQLTGDNTFSGETFVRDGGRLVLGGATALQNSPLNTGTSTNTGLISFANGAAGGTTPGAVNVPNAVIGGLTGSRNLSSMINQGSSTATVNGNAGNNTPLLALNSITGITLKPGVNTHHVYTGAINNITGSSTAFTLTVNGSGTQELSGTHGYTGATSITGGTLLISGSGSINSSSGVTIDGGTLRYNSSTNLTKTLIFTAGKISGTNWNGSLGGQTIGSGQTVSPGNSPGTAATTSQTWAAGGTYEWEINNVTGTAGADPGWDRINGSGTLNITASFGNEFIIEVTSLGLDNLAGEAVNFNQLLSYAWLIADFASVTNFDEDAFTVDTTNFENTFSGSFAVAQGGVGAVPGDSSQIYLTYTAIPEPKAVLLGAIGVLLLFRRRRV